MAERVALVTGATGAVGPSVVRAFLAAGYSVRALSAEAPARDVLPSTVEVRLGDVCDGRAVREATAGVDVVVHMAALLHRLDKAPGLASQYQRVNVGGTETVTRAAIAEGVTRLVLLSTIAIYGRVPGQLVDERTPANPDTPYARTKLEAEGVVLSATSGGKPIGTVLRAAAVYGSRMKGNYRRLALAIARRRFVPLGPGLNRRTIVHEADLAGATVLAASHASALGAVFNVSDGRVHALADIIRAIYEALDRRPPRLHVPLATVRAAIRAMERSARLFGRQPPVTESLLEKYTEDIAVDASLIQRKLGFAPAVELEPGWRETMAGLRDASA